MTALSREDGSPRCYPNGKRVYECDTCKRVSPWTKDWLWFGSYKEAEDAAIVPTFCGESCAKKHHEKTPAMPFEVLP